MYATMGVAGIPLGRKAIAQMLAGDGFPSFVNILRAEARFPFLNPLREATGTIVSFTSILPPPVLLQVIDSALESDPHNSLLLYHKALQEVRNGSLDNARNALTQLQQIGPDWPQTKNVANIIKAVEAQKK